MHSFTNRYCENVYFIDVLHIHFWRRYLSEFLSISLDYYSIRVHRVSVRVHTKVNLLLRIKDQAFPFFSNFRSYGRFTTHISLSSLLKQHLNFPPNNGLLDETKIKLNVLACPSNENGLNSPTFSTPAWARQQRDYIVSNFLWSDKYVQTCKNCNEMSQKNSAKTHFLNDSGHFPLIGFLFLKILQTELSFLITNTVVTVDY